MAKFNMMNFARVGTLTFYPGDELDDAQQLKPSFADMEAAGAIIRTNANPNVSAAALLAQAKRRMGAPLYELEALMMAVLLGPLHRGANLTDANVTIDVTQGELRIMPAATLGAGRSITLGVTGARKGNKIVVPRLDVTANTLAFINGGPGAGTILTMPVSVMSNGVFEFDGSNWALSGV